MQNDVKLNMNEIDSWREIISRCPGTVGFVFGVLPQVARHLANSSLAQVSSRRWERDKVRI